MRNWILALGLVAACGAKSDLGEPPGGDDNDRSCLPNCTVGHECCVGGCSGPAADTTSDCCECLEGEIDSRSCAGARCGG
jgi:hypothetical protein